MEQMLAKMYSFQAKINANQEQTIAKVDAWLEEMKAWRKEMTDCLENKEPTSGEVESMVVHEHVPKEEAAMKTVKSTEEAAWGLASSRRAPRPAEEMDPGR
jgi:hypothetical protein